MWGFSSVKDILDVVLVPIVIAVLAPLIALMWKNKHKELEIKTGLVSEISEHVMKTLATIDVLYTWPESKRGEELDKTYKEWVAQSCIINSKIHAYFPDVHKCWEIFSDNLSEQYREYRDVEEKDKSDWEKVREDLGDEKSKIIKKILETKIKLLRVLPL
jgi:hypothetical protein